jgi:hypothetical protein
VNIRIYFKEEVRNDPGFSTNPREQMGQSWKEFSFHDQSIWMRGGLFYEDMPDRASIISGEMEKYVKKVSLLDRFGMLPLRVRGVYKLKSATATVDQGRWDKETVYEINILGGSIGEVIALYDAIRAGKILPAKSWEAEQVKPTFLQRLSFALRQLFLR